MSAETHRDEAGRAKSVVYHGTRWDKRLYVGYLCLFMALMTPFIFAPAKGGTALRIIAACIVAAAVVFAFRGRDYGTIRADDRGVTAYGAIRRWSWAWSDIDHFAAEARATPFGPSPHPCLTVYLTTGQRLQIKPINASPSSKRRDWLDRAVLALNSQKRPAVNPPSLPAD